MGLIHLDAGVIIGILDRNDVHHPAALASVRAASDRRDQLAVSASALAECMVSPARRGESALMLVDELLDRLPIDVVPVDRQVARQAARLRARHRGLRLLDALVIASAIVDRADQLVTTDRGWPTARALGIAPVIDRI